MNDWDNATCSRCGKPFTKEEWEDRHTDPADKLLECHARCCPKCKQRRKRVTTPPEVTDNKQLEEKVEGEIV